MMSSMQVTVTITPVESKIDPEAFNALCDGELVGFEAWFQNRMSAAGHTPTPLIGAERGIVKSYLRYVATRGEAE